MPHTLAFEAKKSLGQNFLTDKNIIHKIVHAIGPKQGEWLAEIGPGQGALTLPLLATSAHVVALDKDPRVLDHLPTQATEQNTANNLHLHLQDALEADWRTLLPESAFPFQLVGNLPYNVGTQVVLNALFAEPHTVRRMVFMLQKEVVERIVAKPGTNDWGRLGVWCHLLADCRTLFHVPPSAFRPQPKVMSSIVEIVPLQSPRHPVDIKKMEKILHTAFTQRRKMLRSSLKPLLSEEKIQALGIDPARRPETLTTEEFCTLANAL